ncbi:radical SAM superfamily enzyme YgiQ (UPF0313 family) [Natranaerovirga pectinivora]|uniref:Radical SAM superfamily enzyme YgiQ (UPF0313 family) n=1 Tax=Natranaerovirga pectinivora TaxID=682400 RepID=A0A4V2V0G6_9FIRM|nr:radical SAM protein [Natranaerovirga pectinivora]TCT16007.1 radical SAM superfamily enzyme YgiQ (UPF0313 family) [Natranaerovirga pectinivora]
MKVYLINMPFYEQEYTKFTEKWKYIEDEYVGISIVETILESNSCEVVVNHENSILGMIERINQVLPDVVMISVMQTSARLTFEFVYQLRSTSFGGKVFIGGWFAKMAWRQIFSNNWPVDYVCYTDAEECLKDWIEDVNGNYMGIATYENFKEQDDAFKNSDTRKRCGWPSNYVKAKRIAGRHTYSIETSRGCPHSRCTFCSQSCGNWVRNKWQPLSLDKVKDQIIELNTLYGTTRFATSDDDLLGPVEFAEKRSMEIKKVIKELPFAITFSAAISVRAATNGTILDNLLDAGLDQLCIGFESADEDQLKRYCKQQSIEENYIAADKITSRNINMLPGLITFDPFATRDTVKKNLKFLFDVLHHYDLGKLTKRLHILTGSPMARLVEKEGLLTGDYLYYDYKFKDTEVEQLYWDFQKYTHMVKELQKQVNRLGREFDRTIGIHHRNVAESIISGGEWQSFANSEIFEIRKKIGDV